MGATKVYFSRFEDVSGKLSDGSDYTYNGHWSWIYTLNNECQEEVDGTSVSIWQWLASQSK